MAIDVAALAEQILEGMKEELEPLGAGALSAGKQEATELAQCLADIAEDRAASEISDEQAKDAIGAQMSLSAAALQTEIGVTELAANAAIKKGLGILGDAGLAAIGLGWAAPILQQAINALP
jgi:hypothetical protein